MSGEAHLWLIRHTPVDGPSGIIHDSDAPADTSDVAGFAALRAELPPTGSVFCSPARRAWETALALSLSPIKETAFREQNFGVWTGWRHNDLAAEFGAAYEDFWRSPACNRPPGGESCVDQVACVAPGLGRCLREMSFWSPIRARSAPLSPSPSISRPTALCGSSSSLYP